MFRHVLIACLLVTVLFHAMALAAPIKEEEFEYQNQVFEHWWETGLEWRLDELPVEGTVPDFRVPYSGHDYPDKNGGTDVVVSGNRSPLAKYDIAFNGGRHLAVDFERQDVQESVDDARGRRPGGGGYGLFGLRSTPLFPRLARRRNSPTDWYGHCNGWTAASMRHAEPQQSVVRNGVTFTPADIKALLAEVYMYAETEFLGGVDAAINPGVLHVVLTNWLGRGEHPVGMETALGETVFNYPAYAYKATITKQSDELAVVQMEVTYAYNSNRELQESPRIAKTMNFHYRLELDENGKIVGGAYDRGSSRVDMLWAALHPSQGGTEGNERGNPYVKVDEVMSIWRDSVPQDLREKWLNIHPDVPAEEPEESDAG
jgi:hypothetical protein